MPLASVVTSANVAVPGGLVLRPWIRRSSRAANFARGASEIRRTSLQLAGSLSVAASSNTFHPVSSPFNPPTRLAPRLSPIRAAAGGGGRKGKRRQGKNGGQQQESGSTGDQSLSIPEISSSGTGSDQESESSIGGGGDDGAGGNTSAANPARRRKIKGAPKGPAARRWSFEQLMAVWDSQFQRVSEGDPLTADNIARVAARGQQRFGRGCVLVQVHVRAKLRGSAAGFGAGPGAAGMGKRGAGKGKGGAKGKGAGRSKGGGEWEEPTAEVLMTTVEYVPRGMLLLEDDGKWGVTEEQLDELTALGSSKGGAAAGARAGEVAAEGGTGTAREVGGEEWGSRGEERVLPVVSQADLAGMIRCAGDSSRLLQLTAPLSLNPSSSSSRGMDGETPDEEGVLDAELVEGGRTADEKARNEGEYQAEDLDAMFGEQADWGGEAPYDESRGEFVLVLWLHMDGQAVAGADVVRVCHDNFTESVVPLKAVVDLGVGGEMKLLVRDLEGMEEEEELEIV